jgi:hypothetical protein
MSDQTLLGRIGQVTLQTLRYSNPRPKSRGYQDESRTFPHPTRRRRRRRSSLERVIPSSLIEGPVSSGLSTSRLLLVRRGGVFRIKCVMYDDKIRGVLLMRMRMLSLKSNLFSHQILNAFAPFFQFLKRKPSIISVVDNAAI